MLQFCINYLNHTWQNRVSNYDDELYRFLHMSEDQSDTMTKCEGKFYASEKVKRGRRKKRVTAKSAPPTARKVGAYQSPECRPQMGQSPLIHSHALLFIRPAHSEEFLTAAHQSWAVSYGRKKNLGLHFRAFYSSETIKNTVGEV